MPRSAAPLFALMGFLMLVSPAIAEERPLTQPSTWLVEDIGGHGILDRVQATMEFGADGQVSGSSGCNRYHGTAEIAGKSISFGMMAGTRMMCPPATMDQEQKFFKALETVKNWKIDGGILFLTNSKGTSMIRLSPMEPDRKAQPD